MLKCEELQFVIPDNSLLHCKDYLPEDTQPPAASAPRDEDDKHPKTQSEEMARPKVTRHNPPEDTEKLMPGPNSFCFLCFRDERMFVKGSVSPSRCKWPICNFSGHMHRGDSEYIEYETRRRRVEDVPVPPDVVAAIRGDRSAPHMFQPLAHMNAITPIGSSQIVEVLRLELAQLQSRVAMAMDVFVTEHNLSVDDLTDCKQLIMYKEKKRNRKCNSPRR